jgi:hypothetical protein
MDFSVGPFLCSYGSMGSRIFKNVSKSDVRLETLDE